MATTFFSETTPAIFEHIVKEVPLGLVTCNEEGGILSINPFLQKIMQMEETDIIGWYAYELFVERDRLSESFSQVLSGRIDKVHEACRILNPDQETVWCKVTFSRTEVEEQIFGVLQVQRIADLSLQAQENLAQDDILKVLDRQLEEGIFRSSNHEGMVWANNRFLEMFGYTSVDEVRHQDPVNFFAQEEDLERLMTELRATRKVRQFRAEFVRKDHTKFIARITVTLTQDRRGVEYRNGSLIDITDFENSNQMLQRKQDELAKTNAQLDRFLYSASHDLRSPITSMQGLVHLMRLDPKADMEEYISRMQQSLGSLENIINDMMMFAKNTHQRVSSSRIDFEKLINKLLLGFQKFSGFNEVKFKLHIDAEFPFFSDVQRLNSIFYHLVKNALQYRARRSEGSFVEIQVKVYGDRAVVEVTDNGEGIPKMYQDQVFDMFFRATNRSHGPGLGLYIVRETLLKLNGIIRMDSEVGHGTIFVLEIPNGTKGRLISRKLKLYGQHGQDLLSARPGHNGNGKHINGIHE